jgi:hypothetical protein
MGGRTGQGRGALGWIPPDAPGPVIAARGAYLLRQWPAAAAAAEAALDLPGAGVILALARARMGEEDAARDLFAAAVAAAPEEFCTRCARAAFLLRACQGAEALAQADAGLAVVEGGSPDDPLRSAADTVRAALLTVRGGARWLLGQEAMRCGEERRAVTEFEQAARAFAAAASEDAAARSALSERLAAAYVGEAVAMAVAGQYGAAPLLFTRRRAQGMAATPALAGFARDLYELCDLADRLADAERAAAGEALRPALAGAVLSAALWDGGHPPVLSWHGLPLAGARE